MLISKDKPWASFAESLDLFSSDFFEDRVQPQIEQRKSHWVQ